MMTLYHGSNVAIEQIDLARCNPNKDFGKGFYLTDMEEQAWQMALRRTRIVGNGAPTVSAYRFNDTSASSELNIKHFDKPDREWALFILANREAGRTGFRHPYDIVIGPIADDGVAFQLERYVRNLISLDVLVKELTYKRLNR